MTLWPQIKLNIINKYIYVVFEVQRIHWLEEFSSHKKIIQNNIIEKEKILDLI